MKRTSSTRPLVGDPSQQQSPKAVARRLTITLVAGGLALGFGAGTLIALLSDIAALVGAGTGELNLLTTVQLLVTVIAVPIIGRLGDRFGHRRLLAIALGVTALGGALIAVAPTLAIVLIGRALQGAIGTVFVLGPALVRDRLSTERGDRIIAACAGSLFAGTILGMLSATVLGGDDQGTRIALGVAAGVFAVAALLALVSPESVVRDRRSMDVPGAIILILGLGALVLGLREAGALGWGDWRAIGALAAGVLILVFWVRFEARKRDPLIDVRAIGNRRVLPPAVVALAFGVAQYGATTSVITFIRSPQDQVGYGLSFSAIQLAIVVVPCVIVSVIAALLAPRLAAKFGARAVFIIGSALLVVGFGAMVFLHESTAFFIVGLGLQCAGQGTLQAMWPMVLSAAAEPTERGATTGVGQSLETFGGGLSSALFATIMGSLVIAGTTTPTIEAYVWVWAICGLVAAAIIPVALVMRVRASTSTGELPAA